MNTGVSLVGSGSSKFGKRITEGIRELAFEAVKEMMDESDFGLDDIDSSIVGIAGEEFSGQGGPASVIIDEVGMVGKPTLRVESACATGSAGVKVAYSWIKCGLYDAVMVIGVEKMTSVSSVRATELMARGADVRWESPFGVSFPGYYALLASAHMKEYGTTREMLSSVGVKNHYYGAKNPKAHIQKEVSLEEAVNSISIAHPLNLYDCSLISDGAAAVVLAKDEVAHKFTDTPVRIRGIGSGSDTMQMAARSSLTSLNGNRIAGKAAYRMSGISPDEVDVAEMHDCFTIAEIMATEDLGFFKPGEGGQAALDQQTYAGGKVAINVDGGLKAKGHPIGATGVSQAAEIRKQLLGECKNRQVDGAEIGLTHNVGQTGQFSNVILYSR